MEMTMKNNKIKILFDLFFKNHFKVSKRAVGFCAICTYTKRLFKLNYINKNNLIKSFKVSKSSRFVQTAQCSQRY